MMQPMDTLSQLALCCSSGCKRRDYNKPPRNYFYSPTSALLDPNSGWPLAHNPHHYGLSHHNPHQPPPQPYFLLTQPVIITSNSASNPTNTITLVQHAQSAPNAGNFPSLSILGTSTASTAGLQQTQQPNVVTSQYAIYQSPAALNNNIMGTAQATTIYENHQQAGLNRNQSTYILNKSPMLPIMEAASSPSTHTQLTHQHHHHQQQQQPAQQQSQPQQSQRQPATLDSELFRQLEVIEKQVDLSREMELVERFGIVTNRALDPYSLMPHLTEATLRRYHEHFLFNEDSVIRFIEIIKRPGQTLGLYIRTVQFEDPRIPRGTRAGLVVTKIDSDSPIYNSQVLHVGDEILSVNLVDIQGMSLDDVVIIMSMPKRLVLALRLPRERDRLLTANLLQQQQMFRNPLEQRENSIRVYPPTQQQHQQFEVEQSGLVVEQALRSVSSLGGGDVLQRPNLRPSIQFNENHIEQRARQLQQSRLGAIKTGDELFRDLTRTWDDDDDVVGNINTIQDYDLMTSSNMNARSIISKERTSVPEGSRFSRPLLCTSSIGIGGTGVNTSTNNCETILNNNNNHESTVVASTTPSTLPRRTLPTRPISSSQPGTMMKQPVISNLRLGDTPEQSSYFSSSIDAINRELKELRRQRMALSNNEQSVDSTTGVGASRDTGYLASGTTDMSWSENWTSGPEMKLHNLTAATTATNSPPSTQLGG